MVPVYFASSQVEWLIGHHYTEDDNRAQVRITVHVDLALQRTAKSFGGRNSDADSVFFVLQAIVAEVLPLDLAELTF